MKKLKHYAMTVLFWLAIIAFIVVCFVLQNSRFVWGQC